MEIMFMVDSFFHSLNPKPWYICNFLTNRKYIQLVLQNHLRYLLIPYFDSFGYFTTIGIFCKTFAYSHAAKTKKT